MGLVLNIELLQTGSSNTFLFNDITGSWSTGNLTGFDVTGINNPSPLTVISVYVSGTYRAAPSSAPPITIPSYELMPSTSNPLPYLIGQQFVVTPSVFGFTQPTFNDGIYQMTYSVTLNTVQTFTVSSSAGFSNGDRITDSTTGKIIGTIQNISGDVFTLNQLTGYVAAMSDNITNGSASTNISVGGVFGTPVTYTCYPQLFCTVNADCCLGNALRKYCNCGCPNNVELNTAWMRLLAAKEMSECFQYNSALDTLYCVQTYCANCGCGCGQNLNNWNN